jgi:hypothetical protein
MHLQAVEKDDDKMLVQEYGEFFAVTKVGEHWQCGCGYLEKCMLPCRHVLRVLLNVGESIIAHIPDQWRTKGNIVEEISEKKGRDKLSKRKVYF